MEEKDSFVCVECGTPAKKLLKRNTYGYKLEQCVNPECGKVVDKYVEFETNLILINLILCSESIFRHLFYNLQVGNLPKAILKLISALVAFEVMARDRPLPFP